MNWLLQEYYDCLPFGLRKAQDNFCIGNSEHVEGTEYSAVKLLKKSCPLGELLSTDLELCPREGIACDGRPYTGRDRLGDCGKRTGMTTI